MAFLRVMRDKRGYETTLLMHWAREGTRHRSRILYMFRSPGGVRVGRTALERDVLRELESLHPDITFDWNAVRETQQVIEPAPDLRRRRPRRDEGESGAVAAPSASAEAAPPRAAPPREVPPAQPQTPRPQVPATLEGNTPDEQIAFLATWYPQIRDRLALRTADPERKDALLALAERLNPATWTDADQITAGLAAAAEALGRLSRVMARRRRRPRRSPPERGDASTSPEHSDTVTSLEAEAGDSDSEL